MNEELIKRWEKNFGKIETQKLLSIKYKISKDIFIRINPNKISLEDIETFLKKNRIKYSKTFLPNSYKIEKSFFNISSSLPSLTGEIYLQDLASQIPVNCIDFSQFSNRTSPITILDLCASPGSKTTQICNLLNYHKIEYELIALEPEVKRVQKLINNLQKQECYNVKVINEYGEKFQSESKFDLILLDAPCSGNLIGDNNWLNKRDVKGILEKAKLQKELLKNASKLLSDNGTLIYSTCSLEFEENEENVEFAINELKLKAFYPKINFPFKTEALVKNQKSLIFMPYLSMTQGFFVCCFKK